MGISWTLTMPMLLACSELMRMPQLRSVNVSEKSRLERLLPVCLYYTEAITYFSLAFQDISVAINVADLPMLMSLNCSHSNCTKPNQDMIDVAEPDYS